MNQLDISTRDTATGPVLEIRGELDYDSAGELRAAVSATAPAAGQVVVLDLGGLTFCDSSGIATFIAARSHALAVGAGIALASVPAHTARVLDVIGLTQVLTVYPDVESATVAHRNDA
ncbi:MULTISPECIES: STAS domain-containing protein [unclassified Streptomyces]|uniref:STAS domain-containing protein n=1 Tax=unclassified Streptomyces TaxID=2593676 RepID=UPI000CD504F3|nr:MULTISPECIES: STAS domain-containing protein [unclassified Streptomyces]